MCICNLLLLGMYKNRSKFIINRSFQFRFILISILPNLIWMAAVFLLQSLFFKKFHESGAKYNLEPTHPYFQLIAEQQAFLIKSIVLISILMTLLFLIWAVVFSNRIAGPLYRLTQTFKNYKANDPIPHLQFRPGDYFQEIPKAFNDFAENIKKN